MATNAEHQAAWRKRRADELAQLRAEVERLRKGAPPEASAMSSKERDELLSLRAWHHMADTVHKRMLAELEAKHAKDLAALRRAYEKSGDGSGGVRRAVYPNMKLPKKYTTEEWRKRLLKLFHPDKYHGTELEPLANEVSAWLNSLKAKK